MSTYEWYGHASVDNCIYYDASHRSYVENKLSKKTFAPPHLETPKDISTPKVDKPTYGTELYHYANFHADGRETSVPG